jgi:serine/threonine protein kinase
MNPGQMLLHYRIHERIGSGGMGDVYRALDPKLDRRDRRERLELGPAVESLLVRGRNPKR